MDHLDPDIQLVEATGSPFNLSIASARTCYSSAGLVLPEDVSKDDRSRELRDRIADSTLKAGHLTTRQHPQFVFTFDRISRHLIWSLFHSHAHYNSEQVSQRYVAVKPGNYYVPPSLRKAERSILYKLYLEIIEKSTDAYFRLTESLIQPASDEFFRLFPGRAKRPDKWKSSIKKKAMEAARYVLPVATHTRLYHTVNGLTLHRYSRMRNWFDLPQEARYVIDRMLELVADVDPLFSGEFPDPVEMEDTLEYRLLSELHRSREVDPGQASDFVKEFDGSLGGLRSRLVSGPDRDVSSIVGESLRSILGLPEDRLSDNEAIRYTLDPSSNALLASTAGEMLLSRVTRSLVHPWFTFQKKISHTADSQDQRHRGTPGSRPLLMTHFSGREDYITPIVIESHDASGDLYSSVMKEIFEGIVKFIDGGGSAEEAAYLLPNAFPVRFMESGNLMDLHHKWKLRSCYNAQEEIFFATLDEIRQVEFAHSSLSGYFRPPCDLRFRSGITPHCPEGDRYCGVQVWKKKLEDYKRLI